MQFLVCLHYIEIVDKIVDVSCIQNTWGSQEGGWLGIVI